MAGWLAGNTLRPGLSDVESPAVKRFNPTFPCTARYDLKQITVGFPQL
ncbi:rCG47412 [Rattus norvegicus]|uniref:RCG47412 n=1 Tax=Rattus norvegicus TaxID=10116 RepID=A6I0K7_RAT|nr:rCG47412 [Rattus norvegicus]